MPLIGKVTQALVDESDPRAVTKVFNTGFGPEGASRITYIDNDKGKELKVKSQATEVR